MATCQLYYRLANDCPVAWPEKPSYAIDTSATISSPLKRATSTSPVKSDEIWLRSTYLNALYDEIETDHRLLALARSLRKRRDTVIEALQAATLQLDVFDRKWRPDILKTIESTDSPLEVDERPRLQSYIKQAGEATEDKPAVSPREALQRLEIVEVKLQVILTIESLARSFQSADAAALIDTTKFDGLLNMYIDRLVIHQALSGLMGPIGGESQAVEMDETQRFWRGVEDVYVRLLPSADVERVRSKLFTGNAYSALPSLASTSTAPVAPSPFHHPTPDLRRLAQAVSDAAAANAANRIPESPTLAKLIANPSATTTTVAPRPFARSRSTLNAASMLQSRQVQMTARPTLPSLPQPRPHKRKAAEPERIPPVASTSRVLVGGTPQPMRRMVLAPETPGGMEDEDTVPDTPA